MVQEIMSLPCFQILEDFQLDFKIQTPHILQGQIAELLELRLTGPILYASCFDGTQPIQGIYSLSMAAFTLELSS